MAEYETRYQALGSCPEEEHEAPPTENIINMGPESSRESRWNHIENLDDFFARVYQYHQRSGFTCMVLQDVLQLVQFLFVVLFTTFMIVAVDYQTLFCGPYCDKKPRKIHFHDIFFPVETWHLRFNGLLIACLTLALFFWVFRVVKVIYHIFKYLEIHAFFTHALKISTPDLPNLTWHECQRQLLEVQKEQQMCIHKKELTELDIYHRILRFKNYMIAMVNKSLLPLKHQIPMYGEYVFLSEGLKYNLEMLLFWGPWSPFENYWHLRPEYKNYHKRKELAEDLSKRILYFGLVNLIFSPVIFLWQILYTFFRYAEMMKREPGALGSRMWSQYGRHYLRHFNELEHEFHARLNRGYKPAKKYMEIFTSPILVIICKYTSFFAGSILAVIIFLTVIDEDVLAVEHMLTTMTVLGLTITACRIFIPDEHLVYCPELLMRGILGEIHYMPSHWKGQAHTTRIRREFAILFQYRAVHLVEELLSPFLTPLILCFCVRHKALDIVDFFRNFSVEVTGVGDVCSFAQMDVWRHGNPQWVEEEKTEANQKQQAEDGKTELSLMHFTLTNPEWKPPQNGVDFLNTLREQVQRDALAFSTLPALDNPLMNSLSSIGYGPFNTNTVVNSMIHQSTITSNAGLPGSGPINLSRTVGSSQGSGTQTVVRGGVKNAEGPLVGSGQGLLASVHNVTGVMSSTQEGTTGSIFASRPTGLHLSMGANQLSVAGSQSNMHQHPSRSMTASQYDSAQLEMMSREMSFSALYMHELHHRRRTMPYFDPIDDSPQPIENVHLPGIQETDEIEMREDQPLLEFRGTVVSPPLSKST